MLLSVLLGSGTQVFCMSLITLGKIMLSYGNNRMELMEMLKNSSLVKIVMCCDAVSFKN